MISPLVAAPRVDFYPGGAGDGAGSSLMGGRV